MLNSGLLGLAINFIWYSKFRDNMYFLIGICILSGLGGMSTMDIILQFFKNGGFAIKFNKDDKGEHNGK